MSTFINLRATNIGGFPVQGIDDIHLLTFPSVGTAEPYANPSPAGAYSLANLQQDVRGKHLLLVMHGFNWSRDFGLERLSQWEPWLQLPAGAACLNVLWPGDSSWLHGMDYPVEDSVATRCGALLASYIAANLTGVASLSFASHSLGARVLLETVRNLPAKQFRIRHLVVLAGAIDDGCLTGSDYASALTPVEHVTVVRSLQDEVLEFMFPLGNPLTGIFDHTHPYFQGALGRFGPTQQRTNLDEYPPMPGKWNYDHGSYMKSNWPEADPDPVLLLLPLSNGSFPSTSDPAPPSVPPNMPQAWAASFTAARFLRL